MLLNQFNHFISIQLFYFSIVFPKFTNKYIHLKINLHYWFCNSY